MKKLTTLTTISIILFLFHSSNLTAQNLTYCAAKGSFPWEQWIERVSLSGGNFGNASGKNGYADFTSLIGATINRRTGNLITISPKSSWNGDPRNANMFWRVWIDFNGDGDFTDVGETVISRQVVIQSQVFLDNEAAFTPPSTARLGNTRLRVAMKVGGYPEPCEAFERGEIEDYTVNIIDQTQNGSDTLRLVNITGDNTVRQGEKITLNVTIKNTGTGPSNPSTPLSIYQNQQPFIFRRPPPTYLTIVSARTTIGRTIQPNETVTIPVSVTMFPNFSHLTRPDYTGVEYNGTYVVIGNRSDDVVFNPFFFPILDTLTMPFNIKAILDNADLKIDIIALDTTYKKDGKHSFIVKVTNNGAVNAKDVIANLGTITSSFTTATFTSPTVAPQRGTITYSTRFGSGTYILWNISNLAPNESLTALVEHEKFEIPIILPEYTHEVRVGSNQIIDNNASNDVAIKRFVLDTTPIYCASKSTFPWEQWISNVWVFTNSAVTFFPTTGKDGYGNYTNATPAIIVRGQSGLITIVPQSSWGADPRNKNMFWRVWIDLNQDNDFNDVGEMVASRAVGISNGIFFDNDNGLSIPATALLGKTRMRVAMKVGGFPSPCETFERGEVEDYTVNIVGNISATQAYILQNNSKLQPANTIENRGESHDFTVFPNPSNDEVYIDLKKYENQTVNISISDIAGQIIFHQIVEKASLNPLRLDLTLYQNGAYFIALKTENKRDVVKKIQIFK